MKNVLITGATGFIGMDLVRLLGDMGIRPRVLVRRPHRAALLGSFEVDLVQGDLQVPETLARAVEGVDTVIHLGGRASFESYGRLRATIVEGTEHLARRAVEAGVSHFVFGSSLFVYGNQRRPIDGKTSAVPAIGYGKAKLEAEHILARISSSSSMTVANIRLPHVYGPQSILYRQVRNGYAIFPGGMENHCGQLHVEDAARVLAEVARQRWTGTSPVTDSHIVDWREYFEVLRTLYPYFKLIRLPYGLGYVGGAMLEPVLSRNGRPTLYTKDTVVGFNLELPVSPGLVWGDLGLEPRYSSVKEGIPATLDGNLHYQWRHPLLDHRRSR